MGTIKIEEFGNTGGPHIREVTIPDLSKQVARTADATTSTTVESITLNKDTKVVRVMAEQLHRVSMVDSTCATTYSEVTTNGYDYGVSGGETLYYRSDA